MRCWFSPSKIFPAISVCPDEQTPPGHGRSAVDARQKNVNSSKMWENFRLQIAAAFCILQVPYGKSMHKTVLGHLHILQNFLLYLTAFIVEFVCGYLSFMATAAWQWKPDSAASSERALVSVHHRPVGDSSWFLIQRGVFYNSLGI